MHRSTLAEQLQRTLRMPQRRGLKGILGSALKTALSGVAVYVVVNVLAGSKGQKRLKQDFAVAKVGPFMPSETLPVLESRVWCACVGSS